MCLPDSVLAFMLLTAANVEEDNEKLASLKYESMKDKLLQILAGVSTTGEVVPDIKIEPTEVFYIQK